MMQCKRPGHDLREYENSIADIRGEIVSANVRLNHYVVFAESAAKNPTAFAEGLETT